MTRIDSDVVLVEQCGINTAFGVARLSRQDLVEGYEDAEVVDLWIGGFKPFAYGQGKGFMVPFLQSLRSSAVHTRLIPARHSSITLPLWFLSIVFLAYPAIHCVVGHCRVRRRFRKGLCVECGYNLTGLPEPRCPECGTPFDPSMPTGVSGHGTRNEVSSD